MTGISIISISIFTVILILVVVLYKYRNKGTITEDKDPIIDYRTIFLLGIIWIPVGLVLKNWALMSIGLFFIIIGSLNKNKWKKDDISSLKVNKKVRLFVSITLGVLMLIIVFLYFKYLNTRLLRKEHVSLIKSYLEYRLI